MTGLIGFYGINESLYWFEMIANDFHDFENDCFQKLRKSVQLCIFVLFCLLVT